MKTHIALVTATLLFVALSACSGDPDRLAFMNNDEISVMNANGTEKIQLTSDGYTKVSADWSADEKQIVFDCDQDGDSEIYVMKSDGSEIT
ncbi:MAG: hypothetical protein P8J64_04450, partial [Dehalococcoidia bacterium]|nr:hypothetical protein [Dehalococcoidia bacterium]